MKKILFFLFAFVGFLCAAVNINTASLEELKTLKGIGETRAKAILEYRADQNFTSVEELKKVKGIGDKVFEQIKDQISVH
ncbi:ComEA family DNA-binding protein [Campylobacter sp. MIT 97-5078]|uniref:ComEA family DNA-binding protein n=1 Tax=Campylobacter sp. MIT 97-5078 TaxID=1548153 RepID=UPI0005134C9B|nr:ComEA family DNA-binding protein [Campylobacter sp. MIT 97-5078]KGI55794.1 DNA-binding protein [Campylobacter sp. MIT 97-5078]KGI57643.1 DNA-binding protein [Campylobacter sp. MIT 97-5078]TQR26893.1 ComEA family DNA-binding protein [Campylobacter sp. MIT 97-5078]